MWKKTTISQLCQIRLPIIQAGMAGSTSAELVAAVSDMVDWARLVEDMIHQRNSNSKLKQSER
nr:hypothetical protein [Staphylococcus chromogenes]